jgi:hypothetical protein
MELSLSWLKPIKLQYSDEAGYHLDDMDRVPETPGIYLFGRQHGESVEALYVGKANSLRARLKSQFNNNKLMRHVENARAGRRTLTLAEFKAKRGQQQTPCLLQIETALIRYFLYKGDDLVNKQGTRLWRNTIVSDHRPNWIVPQTIYLEK